MLGMVLDTKNGWVKESSVLNVRLNSVAEGGTVILASQVVGPLQRHESVCKIEVGYRNTFFFLPKAVILPP